LLDSFHLCTTFCHSACSSERASERERKKDTWLST